MGSEVSKARSAGGILSEGPLAEDGEPGAQVQMSSSADERGIAPGVAFLSGDQEAGAAPMRFCQPDPAKGAADLLDRAEAASSFLKKLANRDRLMVVCALVDAELSVRGLEDRLGIRQPGLSQQLTELRSAGIILGRKEGKHIFYRLADPKAKELVATLCRLFCT